MPHEGIEFTGTQAEACEQMWQPLDRKNGDDDEAIDDDRVCLRTSHLSLTHSPRIRVEACARRNQQPPHRTRTRETAAYAFTFALSSNPHAPQQPLSQQTPSHLHHPTSAAFFSALPLHFQAAEAATTATPRLDLVSVANPPDPLRKVVSR